MTGEPVHGALTTFGYTEREAAFLRLASTHSGYFLRRHFLAFVGESHRDAAASFLSRAKALRHVGEAPYGRTTWRRYHVNALAVYEAIGKAHSRNRKSDRSAGVVAAKLLALDYVIAHPSVRYLEEERDKVGFFTEELGVPMERLPRRLFGRPGSPRPVSRYFVDKFPLYVRTFEGRTTVGFTYMQVPGLALRAFGTHLTRYAPLLGCLPVPYEFVFAAESPRHFAAAQRMFDGVVGSASPASWDAELRRYFEVRRAIEAKEWSRLAPEDYLFRNRAVKRYGEPHHELLYHEWVARQVRSESAVDDLMPALSDSTGTNRRGPLVTYIASWGRETSRKVGSEQRSGSGRPLGRALGRPLLGRKASHGKGLGAAMASRHSEPCSEREGDNEALARKSGSALLGGSNGQ